MTTTEKLQLSYSEGWDHGHEVGIIEGQSEGYRSGWDEAQAYFTGEPLDEIVERNRRRPNLENSPTRETQSKDSNELERVEARTTPKSQEELDEAREDACRWGNIYDRRSE